jgi:signal transduction histidine kinase
MTSLRVSLRPGRYHRWISGCSMAGKSKSDPSESASTLRIAEEQTRLAYGSWPQYVDGVPFAVGVVALMCGATPALGRTALLDGLSWLALPLLWAFGASWAARCYRQSVRPREEQVWRYVLSGIWISHALVWGSTIFVFWDNTNPANQAVLCTILLAVMVSYFFVLAPCFPVLLAALLTIAGLGSAQFVLSGGVLAQVFIVALPLFVLVLSNYGWQAAEKYRAALQVMFEKDEMAAALESASRAKSGFLAAMSHELRTPLNAILGYSDLIRQKTFGPILPQKYASYIDDIYGSGSHLLKLINDLLDLAKIEAGGREFHFEPVDIDDVVGEAIKLVEPQSHRACVDILVNMKSSFVVEADARAVKQILTNLLSNAVKFSQHGGIAVTYCERLSNGEVALGVKDTGIGMTREQQQLAVEPFKQVSDVYTVEGHGTGLGLPIVKGLIEAHGGSLHVESAPGRGSKIWVSFPPNRLLRETAIEAPPSRLLAG